MSTATAGQRLHRSGTMQNPQLFDDTSMQPPGGQYQQQPQQSYVPQSGTATLELSIIIVSCNFKQLFYHFYLKQNRWL